VGEEFREIAGDLWAEEFWYDQTFKFTANGVA
jgi:hypothetical protein